MALRAREGCAVVSDAVLGSGFSSRHRLSQRLFPKYSLEGSASS